MSSIALDPYYYQSRLRELQGQKELTTGRGLTQPETEAILNAELSQRYNAEISRRQIANQEKIQEKQIKMQEDATKSANQAAMVSGVGQLALGGASTYGLGVQQGWWGAGAATAPAATTTGAGAGAGAGAERATRGAVAADGSPGAAGPALAKRSRSATTAVLSKATRPCIRSRTRAGRSIRRGSPARMLAATCRRGTTWVVRKPGLARSMASITAVCALAMPISRSARYSELISISFPLEFIMKRGHASPCAGEV